MSDENRRNDDPGRREEDRRWLKVQEQIMNLVTAERTDQQDLALIKTELVKLSDHIDDLDDHLRGVAGHESMDTRMIVLEREVESHERIVHKVREDVGEIKADLSSIKIRKAISNELEITRLERFKEWLKFWGPIVIATLALVGTLARIISDYRAKLPDNVEYRPDEKIRRQIELDKQSERAKDVKKKLKALEAIQLQNP